MSDTRRAHRKISTLVATEVRCRAVLWLSILCLLGAGAGPAHAAAFTVGDRIDLTSTTFVVPIEISDALGVTAWTFDLTYDPMDLQINAGCDPFSGDQYCSLFTGPVTEGDFFAEGAPFNLLVPGFIDLDPITLSQTGLLFAVQGAFGGISSPTPGSGVLASVEFIRLGTGDTSIHVDGDVVSSVPEPTSAALVLTGIAASALWHRGRRRRQSVDAH